MAQKHPSIKRLFSLAAPCATLALLLASGPAAAAAQGEHGSGQHRSTPAGHHHGRAHARRRDRRARARRANRRHGSTTHRNGATPTTNTTSATSTSPASTSTAAPIQSTTTSSSGTGCGSELLPAKPGGGTWMCTFDDEFNASTGDANALNTNRWVPQVSATSGYTTGPSGDWVCYVNSPNNISVSNGALHLTIRKEASPFWCGAVPTQYTGGMVTTYQHFAQTYGRFEVRAQLPQTTVAGLQETLWLWPANDTAYGAAWPDSGEVDFSEFYSEYSNLDIPYFHYNFSTATVNSATNANRVTGYCPIDLAAYNDYAVTWSPGQFVVTINGNTCMVDNYQADDGLTGAAPFDQPFFIALTQALGVGTNAFDPATTPLPATTSIQYVRVWK